MRLNQPFAVRLLALRRNILNKFFGTVKSSFNFERAKRYLDGKKDEPRVNKDGRGCRRLR